MMHVTIYLTHGCIILPSLYNLMHTFIGDLLLRVSNEIYFMWYNALLSYIGTIFLPTKHLLEYSDVHSVNIHLFHTLDFLYDIYVIYYLSTTLVSLPWEMKNLVYK